MWIAYRHGKMLRGALISGKISTTVLFLSLIAMVLLHNIINMTAVWIITFVDGVFMLIAFVHYIFTYWKNTPMIKDLDEA
jgi:phosphatidylglycerophosphate synthase